MIKVLGLVGVLIFGIEHTYAFNYEKCRRLGVGSGEGYLATTTSYVSSTGPCSMFGKTQEQQAQTFYAFNQDKVLEDIAKSRGDYLASFEHILGCKVELAGLRKNYAELALKHVDDQYQLVRKSCEGSFVSPN